MVNFKLNFCRAREIWFSETKKSDNADLLFYFQMTDKPVSVPFEVFHTLIIDITQEEVEIFNGFAKNVKYEINRAENKDGLSCSFHISPIESDIIKNFVNDYNLFNKERSKNKIQPKEFEKYSRAGALLLTSVSHNGKIIVWHSYIIKDRRARLKTSSSLSNAESSEMRNLTGRANRWLHWQDIKNLKQRGFKVYDFGGWYSGNDDRKLLGINEFKETFGGIKEKSYNYTLAPTLKGKLYLFLSNLKNKLK